ncbi:MAG: proteasome accessory factor PafA2 [Candidatus Saccharibacteria bacterium]|nr:proteasome accessory factor PafA2 [Candidatus Saccharibacteria bacterium]
MPVYTAEDFRSDAPPDRIMGTEMEYLLPVEGTNPPELRQLIERATRRYGFHEGQFLKNAARLYQDVSLAEYATPESLGPHEAVCTEMAGERIIRAAAKSVSGDEIPIYRRTGGRGKFGLKSVGYHQNLLTPKYDLEDDQRHDASVLGAYAISRVIWAGAGTLGAKFTLSQKAHDILVGSEADIFRLGTYGDRVRAKTKPVFSWSSAGLGGMEPHSKDWERLEFRYCDAAHSPWARFMGLATGSLVLRLLEHQHLFPEQDWRDLMIKNSKTGARRFARDTDMKNDYETRSGKQITAISLQRQLATMATELTTTITLPHDEVMAAHEWLRVCDDLESTRGRSEDMVECLRDRVEWAARLHFLQRYAERTDSSDIDYNNAPVAVADIVWDKIHPTAVAERYWRKKQPDFFAKSDSRIDAFMRKSPRFTRAHHRAYLLARQHETVGGGWDRLKSPTGHTVLMPDPYDNGTSSRLARA